MPEHLHRRKKNGSCQKNCKACKHDQNEWDALNNPEHTLHDLHVCRAKGRDGSPTFDKAGYELDYDKVMNWFKPVSVQSIKPTPAKERRFGAHVASEHDKKQQMLDAFFEEGAVPNLKELPDTVNDFNMMSAVKERVKKDTGVPWHKVGPSEVRDWASKGLKKAKRGEYQEFSEEDKRRFIDKLSGASLRK